MNRRCAAVAVLTTATTASGLLLGACLLGDPRAVPDAAGAVSWLAGAALLACGGWLGAAATAVALEAGSTGHRRPRAVAPAPLRRAVLLACGVVVVGGLATPAVAVPAPAVPAGDAAGRVAPSAVVDGLPLPRLPAPGHVPPARRPATHVVRDGESLWSITADLLGPRADDAAVAHAWPLLRAANRDRLPADPDLLHPGQRLRLPAALAALAAPLPHRPDQHRTDPASSTERPHDDR